MSKPEQTILQMSRAIISREGCTLSFQFNSAGEAQSAFSNFMGNIGHAHHAAKAGVAADHSEQPERQSA